MKQEDFKIMSNIKIIEELKANIICIIGDLYKLLQRAVMLRKILYWNVFPGQ